MPAEVQDMLRQATGAAPRGSMTATHWILVCNTVVLAALVGGVVWFVVQISKDVPPAPVAAHEKAAAQISTSAPAGGPTKVTPDEPLSVAQAQAAYAAGDFKKALDGFASLLVAARARGGDAKAADFFLLRVVQCRQGLAHTEGAGATAPGDNPAFAELAKSSSPVIRATANYHLALIDAAQGRHLSSRMHAYAALACLDLLPQADAMRADCDLLVAQALAAAGGNDPSAAHVVDGGADLLTPADHKELRALLEYGSDALSKPILGVQIEKATADPAQASDSNGLAHGWKIASLQAPLQEVLQQCASASGCDVQLVDIGPAAAHRPVTLFASALTTQRLFETVAGLAGLIARFEGDKVVVYDPQAGGSMAASGDIIRKEGISAWRRVTLRYPQDKRLAAGHLALGTLLEASEDLSGAVNEYQLTAARYPHAASAPVALLRSAKVKVGLRDFVGARKDLLAVVDGYPDNPNANDVYLQLGDAALNLCLSQEAADTFKKVFDAQGPAAAKAAASLGAAKASWQMQKYEQGSTWAKQYLAVAGDRSVQDRAQACLVLGRCEMAQNHYDAAASAFARGLGSGEKEGGPAATRPDAQLCSDLTFELAQAQTARKAYAAALGALQSLDDQNPPQAQRAKALMLRSQVLRAMGLPQEAAKLMSTSLQEPYDADQKLDFSVELANSYAGSGRNQEAYEVMVAVYPRLKGQRHHRAGCDLARLCLEMNKLAQATLLCNDLLKTSNDAEIRSQAGETLAKVLVRQNQYEKAAVVLSTSKGPKSE